jgi:hypothetical protein
MHCLIRSEVTSTVERLLWDKRGENRWVTNLVRITKNAALAFLSPESVERCGGRYHAAGTRQKTTSRGVFCELQA